jgi:hypothetical protein
VGPVNRYSAQREEILRERQAGAVIAGGGGGHKRRKTKKVWVSSNIFHFTCSGLR